MKKILTNSAVLTLIVALIMGISFSACSKKSDPQVKEEATNVVNNYKTAVDEYVNWVNNAQPAADLAQQAAPYQQKVADAEKAWNDGVANYQQKLTKEDYTALEGEFNAAKEKLTGLDQKIQEKVTAAQQQPAPEQAPAEPAKKEEKKKEEPKKTEKKK